MPWNWLSCIVGAICGLVVGGFIGVSIMCIVSIERWNEYQKNSQNKDQDS